MIQESATIDLLNVQIKIPTSGFILGRGKLNIDTLGPGSSALQWVSYLAKGTRLNSVRGGKRSGVTNTMEVGTLSIVLRETGISVDDGNLIPNTPIRFIAAGSSAPFFTGTISDIDYAYEYDKGNNVIVKFTTISAVDAVQSLANTVRYGALSPSGNESWEDRMNRLFSSALVPVSIPAVAGPATKYTLPPSLDGWSNYGATPAGVVQQALRSDTVFLFYGNPTKALVRENSAAADQVLYDGTVGIQRTLTGLTVGKLYRIDATAGYAGSENPLAQHVPNRYKLGVIGVGSGTVGFGFAERSTPYPLETYYFVATASSHQIAVLLGETVILEGGVEGESLFVSSLKVQEIQSLSTYVLQDVVYESSLLNHFDLACMSANAFWWVDRSGVTQFSSALAGGSSVATFTDARSAGRLEYVSMFATFDTRSTVNDLELTNHGAMDDPEKPGNIIANDLTENFKDDTSIATWGPRTASADVSLYEGGSQAGAVARRAAELTLGTSNPARTVTRIRWNAQENPALVASLEIYSLIDVIFQGSTQQSRIVNIRHDVTPSRWMITLELIRR
jgi:hypothetical protein